MISDTLKKIKIVPVLVAESVDEGLRSCETLCANGLPAAEITFRTAAADPLIRAVTKRFPEMTVGAGTVLNVADLHRAADAGASFAVAPGFNPTVVREALKCGIDFIPGVLTPGEIEQALELGLRLLKFFPAEAAGGVTMLKALYAPYKHLGVSFMPTGGVKVANVEAYLATPGVAAVGGTWLNNADAETVRAAAGIAAKYRNQA